MRNLLLLFLLSPGVILAQTSKRDSIWAPLTVFVGQWHGEGGGEPGNGRYERSYTLTLNRNFLEIHNTATYPPTEKNPKGEVHEDKGFLFYDKGRKTFLLRQYHVEGFVNDYVLESISPDRKTLVFVSESIVNIPKGWRARETYHILSNNEIEETFELAPPDQPFAVYSRVKLIRRL